MSFNTCLLTEVFAKTAISRTKKEAADVLKNLTVADINWNFASKEWITLNTIISSFKLENMETQFTVFGRKMVQV